MESSGSQKDGEEVSESHQDIETTSNLDNY